MSRFWKILRFVVTAGVVGLFFFLLLDVAMWILPPNRGWASWSWRTTDAIGVGGGFSVSIAVRGAHPMLAEYDQRLVIFGGGPRDGRKLATLELPMNTGGRVRILVYRRSVADSVQLALRDRYQTSLIDLTTQKITSTEVFSGDEFNFIGAFSGEAYPLKFVPASVWASMSSQEKGEGANKTPEPTPVSVMPPASRL